MLGPTKSRVSGLKRTHSCDIDCLQQCTSCTDSAGLSKRVRTNGSSPSFSDRVSRVLKDASLTHADPKASLESACQEVSDLWDEYLLQVNETSYNNHKRVQEAVARLSANTTATLTPELDEYLEKPSNPLCALSYHNLQMLRGSNSCSSSTLAGFEPIHQHDAHHARKRGIHDELKAKAFQLDDRGLSSFFQVMDEVENEGGWKELRSHGLSLCLASYRLLWDTPIPREREAQSSRDQMHAQFSE